MTPCDPPTMTDLVHPHGRSVWWISEAGVLCRGTVVAGTMVYYEVGPLSELVRLRMPEGEEPQPCAEKGGQP